MKYTLMHKNIPVTDMEVDKDGSISKIYNLCDERHLPIGIHLYKIGVDRAALNEWWKGRAIPASRDGIWDALNKINMAFDPALRHSSAPASLRLSLECFGLSLSDQYWVSPTGSGLKWEDVNFFQNDFSSDMGKLLFGQEPEDSTRLNLKSPDNTSDGWLRKKWVIADGTRYLVKGSGSGFRQEPFNEVIATTIMERLGINHVPYTLIFEDGKPYSVCANFLTPNTELVPAWRVHGHYKQLNSDSLMEHILRSCQKLGMPDPRGDIEKMLTLDYIIANEDRHYNNFGFVRNAETLEWEGMAPIYDSGTSLWCDSPAIGQETGAKPFSRTHAKQIQLVKDFSWFDASSLSSIRDECQRIFSQADSKYIDESRIARLTEEIESRIQQIELIVGKSMASRRNTETTEYVPDPEKSIHGNDAPEAEATIAKTDNNIEM